MSNPINTSIDLADLLKHIQAFPTQVYPAPLQALPDLKVCLTALLWDFWQKHWQTGPATLKHWLHTYTQHAEQASGLILACWTLSYPGLNQQTTQHKVSQIFEQALPELLKLVSTQQWLSQANRREEWARWWCRELEVRLQNESPEQSERRWQRLSSLKRARLFQELRQQRRRQMAIQRAQARLQTDLD